MIGEALGGGIGLYGISTNYDGVQGRTLNANAAAVAAFSPDNNGRAYWGTGYIQITGKAYKPGGGSWTASSDARIKKDVKVLEWSIDQLKGVHPVKFKYNGLGETEDDGRQYVGVIAQDLEKVLPEMVSTKKAKFRRTDQQETDIKMVDPSAFTYILINAVKEQQELIERQESRIAALERARGPLSSSSLNGGLGAGLALGLLPLGFVALRRRKRVTA